MSFIEANPAFGRIRERERIGVRWAEKMWKTQLAHTLCVTKIWLHHYCFKLMPDDEELLSLPVSERVKH